MRRRDLLFAAAASALSCSSPKPQGRPVIQVSLNPHWSMSPTYLADELGFFRGAGFELKIHRLRHQQAVPLLLDGKLDVIYTALPPSIINAVSKGMAVRLVAAREYVNASCGDFLSLYMHRKSVPPGPVGPQHFRGKRFSVRKSTGSEFALDVYLKHFGVARSEIRTVPLDDRASAIAIADGKIDGLIALEFGRSPAAQSPDVVRVIPFSDLKPKLQYSFIYFGPRLTQGDVDTGARYLAAYLDGAQQFLAGKTPKYADEFVRELALDKDKALNECRDTFQPDGSISVDSVQQFIDWNLQRGYIDHPLPASRLCDSRFIERAHQLRRDPNWRAL